MRLTLRTLLAYLDEILDPADADQLHRKIQDSEFATALVHQIRGSVRRLRLDAPALDAQGIGGDVNTVAEYLDNTLPPEQVPSLEKVCLENETHLGEVASSHQILTLVLGEAANVSERMRERAYEVAPTVARPAPPPLSTPHVEAHLAHPSPPSPVSAAIATPRPPASPSDSSEIPSGTPGMLAEPIADGGNETLATVTGNQEPSQRTTRLTDVPSTKETWRAESQQGLTEPDEEVAMPVVPVQPAPIPVGRPDYLEQKSSWLRPVLVTAVIGLLILLGLMFATPLGDNGFLSGWFGSDPVVVTDNDVSDPSEPAGEQIPRVTEPVDIIEVSKGTSAPNRLDEMVEQIGFPEPQDATEEPASPPRSNDEQVDEGPRSEQVDQPEEAGVMLDERLSATPPDDVPPEVSPDDELPPAVETIPSIASTERAELVFGGEEAYSEAKEIPDAIKVNPTLPAKETVYLPEVPPAPTNAGVLSARTETPSVPLVASVAPLVDPSIDLASESTLTDLPEVSPAPNAIVDESATPLPENPRVPEPMVVPKLAPTKLKASQLLLAFDGQDWKRADDSELLESGDFLMCLPAFRSDIEIGSSLVCSSVGATRLQLGPDADVTLFDGQLLWKNLEANNTQGVRFQNERLEIAMLEEGAVVAIEATRDRVPGSDLDDLPHSILKVLAVKQPIRVGFLGQDYQLEEGQYLLALDNYAPRVETAPKKPTWISLRTNPDSYTIRNWKRTLDDVEDIRVWLRDHAENRYFNERALSARCLAELDEFDAIVSALNDREQHSYWDQHFATLKRAVTRGGDTLGKLQLELERVHGANTPLVMEMIRGYNEKQLAEGAATELVALLDHPRLDHRVLAFQNLKSITGFTQAFRPEKAVQYRRRAVDAWKKRLKHGHVRYNQAPEVVALLESFATEG